MEATIRITSKRDGFRRGGLTHPTSATTYPGDRFTEEQLQALLLEPMLNVEILEGDEVVLSSAVYQGNKDVRPPEDLQALAAGGDPGVDDLLLQLDGLRSQLNQVNEQLLHERGKNETLLQEKEQLAKDVETFRSDAEKLLEEKSELSGKLEAAGKTIETLGEEKKGLEAQIAELKKPATTTLKEGKKK